MLAAQKRPIVTREQWLEQAVALMRPWFAELDEKLPETIRVSVGWTRGSKSTQVGWCAPSVWAADGSSNIYISPERDEVISILGTVLHELNHASDDCASGHQGHFARLNRALGFEGKPTSSAEKSQALLDRLQGVADLCGPYPHSTVVPGEKPKTQTTYMVKVGCPPCSIVARMTRGQIDKGLPTCVCGEEWVEYPVG